MLNGHYLFRTELGWMGCLWSDEALARLTFGHATKDEAADALLRDVVGAVKLDGRAALAEALAERLRRYAAGERDDFLDVPLANPPATEFKRRVIHQCRRIPPGKTLTYAQLAQRAGSSGAARAVGNIMATNPVPLIVPCHRVVGSAGGLGGYSAPQGLAMKRRLLQLEKAT